MIKLGQKVRFDPFKGLHMNGVVDVNKIVNGVVVYVSEAHKWFGVEYTDGENTWKTSFKFDDIGDNVEIVD